MMKIKIAETAQKHGVKSAYALQKALDISPTIAARLWKGDFDKIGIKTLERLCGYFNCQTDAFLEYPLTQSSNTELRNDTQLSNTQSRNNTQKRKTQSESDNAVKNLPELPEGDKWLKTKDIAERLGIKALSTIRDFYNSQGLPHTRVGMVNYVKESDLIAFLDKRAAREKSKH